MKPMRLLLIVILSFGLCLSLQAQDNEYNLDETYAIESEGTIHLNSDDAEVNIKGTDRSDVHLVVHYRVDIDGWKVDSEGEFSMEVENKGGDLYIREAADVKRRIIFGSVDEEYRITIKAPRNVALNLKGDDDSYQIADIGGSVKIDADDSDIELNGTTGRSFNFNIDDGNIQMEQGAGKLKLAMDDGEFFVRQAQFDEIEADFDDGELDITTTLVSEGMYKFDMDDGDIELHIAGGGGRFEIDHDDPNIRVNGNFEEVSSDEDESVYQLPGGNARIEIDTDDGSVELRTI